eukprot:scaffold348489_cov28-Prasinocladus_malaysianus.AAC.1
MYKLELFLPEDYPMAAPKVRPLQRSSSLLDKDLPSQHRQAWQDMPRHSQGQMEPRPSDPYGVVEPRSGPACMLSSKGGKFGMPYGLRTLRFGQNLGNSPCDEQK